MLRLVHCLLLTMSLQIAPSSAQDLKSIFHIPSRRNYDDLEILERSNFNEDSAPSTSPVPPAGDAPRSYANAQVMLRFGAEPDRRKCACGDVCQCGAQRQPQYIPMITPLPYCCCVPPYYYAPPHPQNVVPPCPQTLPPPPAPAVEAVAPKPDPREEPKGNEVAAGQNDNVVDEQTEVVDNVIQQNIEVKNNNHPEILETVTLPENSIKSEDISKVRCLEEVSNKLEPNELSPNVKIVNFDLSEVSKNCKCSKKVPKGPKKEIDECLVSYTSPKQAEPKLLLTYPIFNKPTRPVLRPYESTIIRPTLNSIESPVVRYTQSGYSVSGGSGFYSDPLNTVIYRKPTLVQIVGPQTAVIKRDDRPRYICVPVVNSTPTPHTEDCCCCSCAKYVGEINEQEQPL